MAGEKTKAEIETEQKIKWLDEHLPYELMMVRYTIKRLKEYVFWLDWNAYHSAFAVAAANMAGFLTNNDTGNLKAADFAPGFKARKGELAAKFAKMEPQIFHLGKGRPSEAGKFKINDATEAANWIESEMGIFLSQLGDWEKYWNAARAVPQDRPRDTPTMSFTGLEPQTASSADPVFVSYFSDGSKGTGPNAESMAAAETAAIKIVGVDPEDKK
jgi:hypothetical protein